MAVEPISPEEARRRQQRGAVLVDVREPHERAAGMAEGALGVSLAELVQSPAQHLPEPGAEVLLICEGGARSHRCGEQLLQAGYRRVASVEGGTRAWAAGALPLVHPADDPDFYDRYSRHLRLPEVGEAGQRRLLQSRVAVVGAGGLGSPLAYYLAAAGVGTLAIADDDVVERSNLQRQILHAEGRIGMPKVESARQALLALNPGLRVEAVQERITSANVERFLHGADVVVDGGDNLPMRYLLNDACVKLRKPLVYGAIDRFNGQASVFDAGRHRGELPCYRCLFPEPPPPEFAPSCSDNGVLGVLPGVIGVLQATEVVKLLLDLGEPLSGRLLRFDALAMRFRETRVPADPDCVVCAPGREFPGYIDYARFCAG
ncbi:molybdopterin-synthase adenylyltransferase MoeB [Novilysobacter defluvii]|uniref:molybdopterin-synthase adenylyltransferase MoeB n=1 Tax=Novilysobacter defluvii TaxID=391738 RepID=UPI00040CBFAF|nr:molybdopterin-synthase adenylyltransferase MoeB [Lysobacter defluvii]